MTRQARAEPAARSGWEEEEGSQTRLVPPGPKHYSPSEPICLGQFYAPSMAPGRPRPAGIQSMVAPEALTTGAHFAISALIRAPNFSGEPATSADPISASRCLMSGSRSALTISAFSLSTIGFGVLPGATTPYHAIDS